MPRFFFHLYDDLVVVDHEGQDFPSLEAARNHAVRSARELACAEVLGGKLNLRHRIEVADAEGCSLTTVLFSDVVNVET